MALSTECLPEPLKIKLGWWPDLRSLVWFGLSRATATRLDPATLSPHLARDLGLECLSRSYDRRAYGARGRGGIEGLPR
ncbi:hypothetical protein [Segnochrobactrum spirostomi]|uniref:Uncharacterized protein n=1 Tax=Segnochrobactrum spirostomi TaxID=2608987 RepID=A0A6A7Y0V2_9HYPH|nr:hypothetical protein [Segnochrobactrum spirostomi]MQT12246.1 hypothetical protein [Segnochrobactrum spirostomi]